jgi:hypothetical protein
MTQTAPPSTPPPRSPAGLPRQAAAPRSVAAVPTFAKLSPKAIAPRVIINGVEGWGKTSLAANAPGAALVMARGETGYQTLLNAGRVPSIPCLVADSWDWLLGVLDGLVADPGEVKTLALDALGGFERLCHEHVCARDFAGNWGEKGFGAFAKGYDLAVTDWLGLLNRLDRINEQGVAIWILSHVGVRPFKNPLGPDFDRYEAACHAKTWSVTHKWADAVLFANFRTVLNVEKGEHRKKGIGGTDRVIYTERRDAWDAKNRFGMPEEIDITGEPAEAFQNLNAYLTNSAKG